MKYKLTNVEPPVDCKATREYEVSEPGSFYI